MFLNGLTKIQNYKKVNGYNITTSDDGQLVSMEVHSVIKDIHTGELIDFTTDFCGQEYKFFIECDWMTEFYIFSGAIFGYDRAIDYILNKEKHRDKINGMVYEYDESKLFLCDLQQLLEDADYKNFDYSSYKTKLGLCVKQVKEIERLGIKINYENVDIKQDSGLNYDELYKKKGYYDSNGLSKIFGNADAMVYVC